MRRISLILFILLASGFGCKSTVRQTSVPPPLPSGPSADGTQPETITAQLEKGWIDVSLTLPGTGSAPFPVVISPILPDEEFLAHGFAVARFHTNWQALLALAKPTPAPSPTPSEPRPPEPTAEAVGKWLLTAPRPGIVGRGYFDLITADAETSLPAVVDWLVTRPEVDARRIALTGSSTSGFTALQGMAAEPRIAVGVVRVACGDYLTFLKSSSLALDDDPRWLPGGKLVLDPDYAVEIAAREPIRHADLYPPRPLLLMAGERDRAIPLACVENTVVRFRAAYAAAGVPDHFEFVAAPEEGHNLSADMNAEIVPWLERWLGADVSAAR
ncbi:prolyl oligopeptidase family serine peptidase [Candidatus Binatia bacterium]|nr:prolyl oligopeptidase family serine peptidase [Candidatus Binatia bacterium]